ncbi:hypothetical protein N7532_011638 [Penicillium argentinense]|uniref:TFIIS N-terminal domain-containing protein n=1 Tax=Penicillium argentinense TaxID=1131581 RepID=A0A9W9EIZ4_9EURO|nr:uncharacterized protein N7532_011638 [Penicillium argentinense]KAJ5082595.1 hypothetical protein N7532_011638 [Penicillium argentinense]
MSASPEHAPEPAGDDENQDDQPGGADDDNEAAISDDESLLSEVDEAQFEDFDPENVDVEDRPQLAIDEENLRLIGRHKRKREEGEGRPKRHKEGRREKKRRGQQSEVVEDGSPRRRAAKNKTKEPDTDDETMDPAERRKRALDRKMDEAMRPTKRRARKQDGIDLEAMADKTIEQMRQRMTHAAQMDAISRGEGKPAMHKLKLLPEVLAMLNRTQYQSSLVDPDINLLEGVKFFLEPLDDGSMPAFNIQRDLLNALTRLPIKKDALIASGIGKVVVFYTKSKRTERSIKETAEKLLAEWTRPILQRSDDYSKRVFQQAVFDPSRLNRRTLQQPSAAAVEAEARAREMLPPRLANRARVDRTPVSYNIVPVQTGEVQPGRFARPLGASGEDRFRKMQARQNAARKASRH